MKREYLVDVENVREFFTSQLKPNKGDEIILFCTEHVPKMNHTKLAEMENGNYRFMEVKGGKQSLDMHLSSFLGHIISRKREYVIVSNDTDYDGIIEFWNNRGYNVSRKTIEIGSTADNDNNEEECENDLGKKILSIFDGKDYAKGVANIALKKRSQGKDAVYREIILKYGQLEGLTMYNKIKKII